MQSVTDLDKIKKKVYMSYFEDGLWDLLLGIYLCGWGISIAFDMVAVMGGIWVVVYFAVLGLKKMVTYPRAGYIKIPEAKKHLMRMVILGAVLAVLGLNIFTFVAMGDNHEWMGRYIMFLFGSLMSITVALLAFWWRVTRWYLYAALMLVCFCLHQWADLPLQYSFFIPGGLFSLYGLAVFIRFLRRYPKSATGENDVIS